MTAFEHEWLRQLPPPRSAERKFRTLAVVGTLVFAGYLIATVAGARSSLLSPVFALLMVPLPFMAWWAYARAMENLRRPVFLLALAATFWLLGSLVWQGFYVADGNRVPHSPGVWDAFFVSARLLVIVALVVAMRSLISLRLAALDATVIVAAGLSLAAPFAHRGLADGITAASVFTLNRPLLSIVTLMLIVSAALGSCEGLPRSIAMLGLAEIPLMVGNLIYSYQAVQGDYADDRWANLAWGGGALMAMLAASVIVLRIDRPVSLLARPRIPNHPSGSRAVLLLSLGALGLTVGIACYGLLTEARGVTLAGLLATVSIGIAMGLRAGDSIRTAEDSYARLDRALAESERTRDELARANAEIRAVHVAYADLLNLVDERTHGRVRGLVEDAASELAELLEEEMEAARQLQPRNFPGGTHNPDPGL